MSIEDSRPENERLAAELRQQILLGNLAVGAQLPSTAQLAEKYGVATATVQGATARLKSEGYLTSRTGKGVYVAAVEPLVVSTAAYIEPQPGRFSYDVLDVDEVVPPVIVGTALGIGPGDPAILRHRLMRHNGEPVELSWSYYPAGVARGTELARRARIRGGAPRVLADLGRPQRELVDRISIRPPTTVEVEQLELPRGVPVMQQFRVIYTDDQVPVEVSLLVKGGHRYVLQHRFPVEP